MTPIIPRRRAPGWETPMTIGGRVLPAGVKRVGRDLSGANRRPEALALARNSSIPRGFSFKRTAGPLPSFLPRSGRRFGACLGMAFAS